MEAKRPEGGAALPEKRRRLEVVPEVFFVSGLAIVLLVGLSVVDKDLALDLFGSAKNWIVGKLGWLFLVSVLGFLLFALGLAVSPWGRIRLGKDDEKPEFSYLSWFAMLFSAGMGIGLLFFSVAEPMYHYASPPSGQGGTEAAEATAMGVTYFHWGLHAWAVYVVVGLCLAYYGFRKGLPLSIRSTLHPLIGDRIHGVAGHVVDTLAVFGTVFGLATSLGLGAMQINSGLTRVFGVASSQQNQIIIISVITVAATISLITGVKNGIRRLSELNLVLALCLLLFVLFAGPTGHVLSSFGRDLAAYAQHFGATVVFDEAMGSEKWQSAWTVFYWAWWIAWAPFVGTFVARISRGRTIREFILGVLLVPTVVTFIWLTVFGESAIFVETHTGGIAAAVEKNTATAIYALLENFPFKGVTTVLAVVVVATFFVTSSDSGSFVVDILTSGGHPNPPIWQRIFWALTEGAVAIVLLVAGGLKALQAAAISTGLPFCLVMIVMCVAFIKALRSEKLPPRPQNTPDQARDVDNA